jgi:hypothetical protein
MKKNEDPLIGAPVDPEDDAMYAAWSERIEADDISSSASAEAYEGEEAQHVARALLDEIVGREALERAIGRGRPTLAGAGKRGESPKVQVRLTHELQQALKERAMIENRKPSEVVRDAIALYLRNGPVDDHSPAPSALVRRAS